VRYSEDGVEEGGISSCHGENDVPERVGGFVDGRSYSAYMAWVSVDSGVWAWEVRYIVAQVSSFEGSSGSGNDGIFGNPIGKQGRLPS
jgi:hypothetical protein